MPELIEALRRNRDISQDYDKKKNAYMYLFKNKQEGNGEGVLVSRVEPDRTAHRSGVRCDDILFRPLGPLLYNHDVQSHTLHSFYECLVSPGDTSLHV